MTAADGGSATPDVVHLMGIGGAGMSGLATLLTARGVTVTGCDTRESPTLERLRGLGVGVTVGHDPSHLAGVTTVVTSSAVRADNSELLAARTQRLRVLRRAGMLAELMAGYRRLVVAGTHGKTTTTSMLTVALQACGVDPSYAIGGDLPDGTNARHGSGSDFVAEADESDGSFLEMTPYGAVVTNVEPDHLDNYGDEAAVRAAFREFLDTVEPGGVLVLGADDPGSAALAGPARERGLRVRTFGRSETADVRVADLRPEGSGAVFALVVDGADLGEVRLAVPGAYNALNAAAAFGLALALDLPFDRLRAGIAGFTGAHRRFQLRGEAAGVRVYDDYAHHPTELREGALVAARQVAGQGRVIAVFQPHLYSRTKAFAPQFAAALAAADIAVVLPVYAAREDPLPGVSAAMIADLVPLPPDQVVSEPDRDDLPALLAGVARAGDVIVTVGAGDVTALGPEILTALSALGRQ